MEEIPDDRMLTVTRPTIRLFWCYTDRDRRLRDHLEEHLSALKHVGSVVMWHNREVLPGSVREVEIAQRLKSADLVLLLVSAYFLSSKYCWDGEMFHALERWKQGDLTIVPILVSTVDYMGTPISPFQALPSNGKAISEWNDRNKACTAVATGIRQVVDALLAKKWKQQGDDWKRLEQYDLALQAYEEALQRDGQNPILYNDKGDALFHLRRFEDAIAIYDKAIELKSDFGLAYKGKGRALEEFAPFAFQKYQRLAKLSYQQAEILDMLKEVDNE